MPTHHFNKSLKKEKGAGHGADNFYKSEKFKATNIERYNTNSEADLILQRQDIDVKLSWADGQNFLVSEKFREHDYDDVLLELYSKYPHKVGWMHNSAAERLAYFFPARMFWIDKKALCAFCLKTLFAKIEKNEIEKLLAQKQNSSSVEIELKGKTYKCTLTQAPNNTDGDCWNTVSISVPFGMLVDVEVRCVEYELH